MRRTPPLLVSLSILALAGGARAQEGRAGLELGLAPGVLEKYVQSARAKARLEDFQEKYPLSKLDETDLRLLEYTGRDKQLSSFLPVSTLELIRQVREERILLDTFSKIRDPYAPPELIDFATPSPNSDLPAFAKLGSLKKKYGNKELLSLRLAANETIMIVRPGEPVNTPPPALSGTPPMAPLGQAPLTSDGRIAEKYWTKGFSEVGVLTLDGAARCTATLIRRDVALTAAHCVLQLGEDGESAIKIDATKLAFWPEAPEGLETYLTGVNPPATGRKIDKRIRRAVTKVEVMGQGDFVEQTAHDLALIRLAPTTDQPAIAKLAAPTDLPPNLPFDVTLAGYGPQKFGGERGAELHIGWQKVDNRMPTTIAWSAGGQPQLSTSCGGDSGGPVFLGAHRGLTGETRKVVAVTSLRDCKADGTFMPRATAAYLDASSFKWATEALARLDRETALQLAAFRP